jgi:hypothetical protein
LVLRVTLLVPYGNDTAIHVYRRGGVGLLRLLSYQAPPYRTIAGAFSDAKWEVAPADENGRWYVLAANVNPWPSSAWQTLRFAVLRPAKDPDRPTTWSRRVDIYLGMEEAYKLHALSREFTVSYEGATFDLGRLVRAHVERYVQVKGGWSRAHPLALGPVDFLDEWRSQRWRSASEAVAQSARPAARRLHRTLSSRSSHQYEEAVFAQPCPEGDRWLVGLTITRDDSEEDVFVDLHRAGDTFLIRRVGSQRPEDCPGLAAAEQYPLPP